MEQQNNQQLNKHNTTIAIIIVGAMFFIFGLVSWVNAILIPYFKIACELTHFESYFVAFAFYIAYFCLSIPSAHILNKVGYKRGIMYGFICMSVGAALFIPAALTRTYGIFLAGLFVIGAGLTILQSAANPYITIVGPIESAAKRISLMGICNKIAGIISPLIFAAVVLKVTDSSLFTLLESGTLDEASKNMMLDDLIRRVIKPYAILSIILLLFGIFIRYSVLPEIDPEENNKEEENCNHKRTSIFQFPYLILGAIALFIHVGTQIVAIDTIISYAGSMGMNLLEAKAFPSYTLTATIIGYMIGIILIPKYISQTKALQFCCTLGLIFSIAIILVNKEVIILGHESTLSIWFLCALGLPNALIYAGIWPLSIKGLGRFTKIGSSLMIMGLSGNAIMPIVYGSFADRWDLQSAYWILIPCYIYLIFFAVVGHRIQTWSFKKTN
ncbi:sugar MFS transporter [Dysgonomonas sp. Marseille-P4677]|uniref:sugar MFS transporter n=1 Tax=Dysgonomonas sp. Marseille-P4677 TaxID=2364790 RepID=UPI001911A668|nr:sugar MFS transporter [Dysgonomonas sp. Marseille-P4677]MBK5720993.1 sugar MFS transporter [Dysgonomonas sp. Marseille-P4677]